VLEELRNRVEGLPAPALRKTRGRSSGRTQRALPVASTDVGTISPEAATVLEILGEDCVDIDTLALRSGLTVDALYAILLPMELDGSIARAAGNRFQRLRRP
jgi:DNA processing protein